MLTSVQVLRAVAALAVLFLHAATMTARAGYHFPFSNTGASGVDLFFVISGVIMVYTTRRGDVTPGQFLHRRFARIGPPYWVYTSLTVFLLVAAPSLYARMSFDGWRVATSYAFLMTRDATGEVGTILGVGWTLAYEAYFYVVYGVALLLPERVRFLALSCLFGVGALADGRVALPPWAMVAGSTLPLEFLAGCLIGRSYVAGWRLPRWLALALIVAGAAVVVWSGSAGLVRSERDPMRVLVWGMPAAAIVAGALSLERYLSSRAFLPLALVGDASYSLYLCHQFVLAGARAVWTRLHLISHVPAVVLLVVACTLAVAAGFLSYRFIELPLTSKARALRFRRGTLREPAGSA